MEQFTGFFTILMLIVALVAYNLILIVPMRELCVIERLGKFRSISRARASLPHPFCRPRCLQT